MSANLLDGQALSKEIYGEVSREVEELKKRGITPGLSAILLGDDPASLLYSRSKEKRCLEAGIEFQSIRFPSTLEEEELFKTIRHLNGDPKVHGIMIELPLPPQINPQKVYGNFSPSKDVDGFHPGNLGRLLLGSPSFVPSTPLSVLELLLRYKIPLKGKEVVVVGRSNIVGKPLALLLAQKGHDATVTLCHSLTKDLESHTRRAEILIVAVGNPEFIRGETLRKGAIVVDVGINEVKDPSSKKGVRICGDVHFESAKEVASWITPVPGGVGPMTVAMLLSNVVKAVRNQSQ